MKSLVAIALASKTEFFKSAMLDKGVDNAAVEAILLSFSTCEDLVSQTFDLFKSAKQAEKFLTSNSNYVKPVRIPLGSGEFQYVPVIHTLKKIIADRSFQKLRKIQKVPDSEEEESLNFCLSDMEDGRRLRNSKFFQSNHDALRLIPTFTSFKLQNFSTN